jgi:hypothetical protein
MQAYILPRVGFNSQEAYQKEYNVVMELLILIPWVLTLALLIATIVYNKNKADEMDSSKFAEEYENHDTISVAFYDQKAYWVYKNVFYESDTTPEPIFETARPVDTMNLEGEDLSKMLNILDELQASNERD